MSDAFVTLAGTYDQAWQRILRGVRDRHAPARHPVLATVTPDGLPSARVVVLRGAASGAGTLEVHTDAASAKVAQLAGNDHAAFVIWEPRARLQIRLSTRVALRRGAEVAGIWARVPEASRQSYGGHPVPGAPLDVPEDFAPGPDAARFVVLDCRVDAVETLHLGRDRHRRARFERADGFAGRWIAP